MSIQPGVGYTFNSSGFGTNLNIETPWTPWDASVSESFQQFQVRSIKVENVNKLQIAKGTVTFTQSNMPRVKFGGHYDKRQAWLSKVAVYGTGISRTAGAGSPIWMEGGGYYNINSAGTYFITVSKFDINQSNDDTDSELLNAETPWVSIFKDSDEITDTIFSETGPSEYANTTNIHKMTGYTAADIGGTKDWGNCHTTYFNPVKWGYDVKLIAIVYAVANPIGGGISLTIDQHIVGPIDLHIPCQFNGTFLTNRDDLNETNDPYNTNRDSEPAWPNIANASTKTAMDGLTAANTDWFEEFVGPADWTEQNFDYRTTGSCAAQDDDADTCKHPFYIKGLEYVTPEYGAPYAVYNICAGTINNITPLIYDDVSEGWVSMDTIPQPQIALAAGTETWIVLRTGPNTAGTQYPAQTSGSPPEDDPYPRIYTLDEEPPADTAQLAYIILAKVTRLPEDKFSVNQYVTGSLWADRIQVGAGSTLNAFYYYARV
jgi:hypothetical protein